MSDKVKLIYIVGAQYSGTTLMSNMLGTAPEAFNIGEVNHLRQALTNKKKICTCGERVQSCSFWSPILSIVDVTHLLSLTASLSEKWKLALSLMV
jgi:hypothetical protein